jgi:hypothetical protein
MPSREETETVITWTLADGKAIVYSLMPSVWRMCERAGGVEIDQGQGIRKGRKAARTFLVDPGCIRIRPRRKLSAQQVEKARERARRLRKGSIGDVPLAPDAIEEASDMGKPS